MIVQFFIKQKTTIQRIKVEFNEHLIYVWLSPLLLCDKKCDMRFITTLETMKSGCVMR